MSLSRWFAVWQLEVGRTLRRPLFWILILLAGLMVYGMAQGSVQIRTGDSSPGEAKAWATSEFSVALVLTILVFLLYSFFIAVMSGMVVIHDDELRVRELLHASGMRAGEYVWGKFLAVLCCFGMALGLQLAFTMFVHYLMPNAKAAELRGPFSLMNYLRPALMLSLPTVLFLSGSCFALGAILRRPVLVFIVPVALLLACGFFLWPWSPTWLDPRIDQVLMLIDPAGFRWLNNTWLKVDRGVAFYNHEPIPYDLPFVLSRVGMGAAGLLAVLLSQWYLARSLRGKAVRLSGKGLLTATTRESIKEPTYRPLGELGMSEHVPGLLSSLWAVVQAELRELRRQPGLYLFVPIILLETIGTNMVAVGAFDTPLLQTPGTLAVGSMNVLTTLVCLLLLFYTVESLQRETHVRLESILYSTPVSSFALLAGKSMANSLVAIVIMLAGMLGCMIVLLIQGHVPPSFMPFFVTWGLLLSITFFGWNAFVTAVLSIVRNRFTAYAVCLAALAATAYFQLTGKMNWIGNWPLWSALHWTDMGLFELDRQALVLNRLLVLALAFFLLVVAVRWFPRRELDAVAIASRLRPWPIFRTVLTLSPVAAVPLTLGIVLYLAVDRGMEGATVKKQRKDYWQQNLNTWKDTKFPAPTNVTIALDLDPARGWFHSRGEYTFRNHLDRPFVQWPLTGGEHWEKVTWTLDGEQYEPQNRSGLYVFTPPRPLPPGGMLRVGFDFEGTYPFGVTKNGGGASEFILPSGVVLTSFSPSFAPLPGYQEGRGVDEDNKTEAKNYADNFYEDVLDSFVGISFPFTTKIIITAPADYRLNSVGVLTNETVADGRRTAVWESDQPVRFFNVVAGRWEERRKDNTVVYYHPDHPFNVDEISNALAAASKYYSEWFYPYPWHELKLSEFPSLATYAQGFATNITFSEGIGFLTKDDPEGNAAFIVTGHEAAHQWWGNLLTPGKGPGGNVLSEGMAHYSTILLCEQVKGLRSRIEFCKRIEEQYGEGRRKDVERPLVKLDGSRPGDSPATYNKGAWVFWMLQQQMGREAYLKGLRAFIETYRLNYDHPVLQDFLHAMRPFAADKDGFDAFAKQWFHEVVLPEYHLTDSSLTADGMAWNVSVRVENAGTGTMPIDVAASRGERFTADGMAGADYQEERTKVNLGPGESKIVTMRCAFKPERILVDPDALVLQLLRKHAMVRF